MGSKYINCHDFPGGDKCEHATILTANTDEELMEAAVKHGITVHGLANTAEFREKVRKEFREGNPTK